MWKLIALCALPLYAAVVLAADVPRQGNAKPATSTPRTEIPDSKQMERDLQGLPWPQFRAVIESIPKLKADVEAYGTAGWAFVQSKYKTHRWQKNIDKLDAAERRQLLEKIRSVQKGHPVPRSQ